MFRQILYPVSVMLAFFIMLFIYTKLLGPIPFSVESITTNKSDAFTVSGEGKVQIKPDSAIVNVGVSAEGKDTKEAQDKMNQNINKVIEAVKALSIDEKDIKTANYNIYESYDAVAPLPAGVDSRPTVKKYQGNTNITVKVKNVELASQVLDVAIANGATNTGGVTFDVLDKTNAENEARELAVKDAKAKATVAAQAAGFRLGRIINYSEGAGNEIRPVMYEKAIGQSVDSGTPSDIQPGENEVFIRVNISYEIH